MARGGRCGERCPTCGNICRSVKGHKGKHKHTSQMHKWWSNSSWPVIELTQEMLGQILINTIPNRVGIIPRRIAYPFIRVHHYLHYPPRCDKFCLGVYCDYGLDRGLMGVMIFGLPVARLEDQITTLELTRMALLPSPKNSESRALSLAQKWIRRFHPEIKRLIAYADLDRHTGTIYKAANWKEVLRHKTKQTWDRPNRRRLKDTGGCKIKYELTL